MSLCIVSNTLNCDELQTLLESNNFTSFICNDINDINNNAYAIINTTNDIDISHKLTDKCFKNDIPFFDYTIDKNKLQTQVMIPHVTNINNIQSLYIEKTFPLCVTNNFPTNSDHVIAFVKEQCQSLSCDINPIQYSYNLFKTLFEINIQKLLDSTEEKIWENKLKPHVIHFDYNNIIHTNFIYETCLLLDPSLNDKYIYEQIMILSLLDKKQIDLKLEKKDIKIKQDHINWITSAIVLRCENYNCNIPTIDEILYACNLHEQSEIILHAGYKIIVEEIIKYRNNSNAKHSNATIEYNDNEFKYTFEAPSKPDIYTFGNVELTCWDKLVYTDNTTLEEFINYYNSMFNNNISMIANGSSMIYSDFSQENINKNLSELELNNTFLTIIFENEMEIPDINIQLFSSC